MELIQNSIFFDPDRVKIKTNSYEPSRVMQGNGMEENGNNITKVKDRYGLTLESLAALLDDNKSKISRWMKAYTDEKIPDIYTEADEILTALGSVHEDRAVIIGRSLNADKCQTIGKILTAVREFGEKEAYLAGYLLGKISQGEDKKTIALNFESFKKGFSEAFDSQKSLAQTP
jgi:hypothetical protein